LPTPLGAKIMGAAEIAFTAKSLELLPLSITAKAVVIMRPLTEMQ